MPVAFILGAWLTALAWLDYPLARRGKTFVEKRQWVRRNIGPSIAFGIAVLLTYLIPVYNLFLAAPAAAAGATAMYLKAEGLIPGEH